MSKVSQSALLMLCERLFRAFTGIFVSVAVARHLGPEGFGGFSYVTAIVGLLVVFGMFGTEHVLLKDWRSSNEVERSKAFSIAFTLRLLGACFAFLSLNLFAFLADVVYRFELWVYSFVFFAVFANVFEPINMADELGSRISVSQLVVNVLSSVIKLAAVFTDQPLVIILSVYLFESVLQSIGQAIVHLSNNKSRHFTRFNTNEFKTMLLRVLPLVVDGFVVLAYMKIDQLLIAKLLGLEQLGQYSVAVRLIEFTYIVPVVIAGVFNTYIYADSEHRAGRFLRVSNLITSIALIGVLVTFCFGPLVVSLLYGQEFSLAGDVIRYYSMVIPVVFWGVLSSRWLIEQELQKLLLLRNIAGFSVNVILNLVLIPKFGLFGATAATVTAQIVSVCVVTSLSKNGMIAIKMELKSLSICLQPRRLSQEIYSLIKHV